MLMILKSKKKKIDVSTSNLGKKLLSLFGLEYEVA